ncbi:MAG: aconitate hydratase, partial [Coriobacteriaceae bacterium]|nr:aconitate hydratase [Coriobacteriaceae bacterium]
MTPKEPLMATLTVNGQQYRYFPVSRIEGAAQLPYSLCVLLENALRCSASEEEARTAAQGIIEAAEAGRTGSELSYRPARVLLQDFTGVPVFVDFAAMREAMRALGGDPAKVNPQIPCDLVIDHSVIADEWGNASALEKNMSLEFMRNHERYTFLKWAQASFKNVRIVPPGTGICHQINVEEFAPVVMAAEYGAADGSAQEPGQLAYFDTVVGTDSHTTTTNGIGVLSWGVGGIEAEAAALGQAITILVPRVVGIRLTGALDECAQAMDVALVFAQLLRAKGVVGSFV